MASISKYIRIVMVAAVMATINACSVSYKFNGASIDYSQTKTITELKPVDARDLSPDIKMGGANTVAPDAKSTTVTQEPPKDMTVPPRPRHIDQYVHLLPQKTQEHAAQVKQLYDELDLAREKMRLLMDDKTASPADREAWAKKATNLDNRLKKIFIELDREWNKLVEKGRVVVDDLGNARVVEAAGEETEPEELTPEQRKKRKALRKWLVDVRYGNGATRENYVKRWRDNFREFLTYEGDAAFKDERIIAAAEHYGINLEELKNK